MNDKSANFLKYLTIIVSLVLVFGLCSCTPSVPDNDAELDSQAPGIVPDGGNSTDEPDDDPVNSDPVIDGTENESDESDNSQADYLVIELTEDEKALLDAMGADVIVADMDEALAAISADPFEMTGKVYQIEGVYAVIDDESVIKSADSEISFTVDYITKEIADGTPIRLTAIVNVHEHDGHSHIVLECVAVELTN